MKAAARFSLARVSGKGSERTVVNAAASWPESASRPTVENVGWVTKGKRSSEIAPVLDLSIHTVRKHLENAFAKLGLDNRTATVADGALVDAEFRMVFPREGRRALSFKQPTGGARLEKNSPRISQMGTDDSIKMGLAEKSKNLASLLAEFLFYPAPFAQRMHSCPFLHIRVHPGHLIQSIPVPHPSGQPAVDPSRTCHGARLWFYIIFSCSMM